MQDIKAQKQPLALTLVEHDASVETLKADLAKSSRNLTACEEKIEEVEALHCKGMEFCTEVQKSLDKLRLLQIKTDRMQNKLRVILKDLHGCRCEESRQGISGRLCDILNVIQDAIQSVGADEVDSSPYDLAAVDEWTEEILQIARFSAI